MTNKVLVVEDEQILAKNLEAYFGSLCLEVRIAHDGASAIDMARGFQPDLVVLDYRLPDMEGFQVIDIIRRDRNCSCVLMTGHPTSQVCDSAVWHGVGHIFFKPFPLREMGQLVRRMLAGTVAHPQPAPPIVERRRGGAESFPLQLFDGTWVLNDRRQSALEGPDESSATERRRP